MLQAGSDYKHMASSQLLASGQDQFNLSNPRKSSSSRSGKHQCLVQQAGRWAGRQAAPTTPLHDPSQGPAAPVQCGRSLMGTVVRPGLLCAQRRACMLSLAPLHVSPEAPAAGSTGQWCLGQGKTRTCHWVLPRPQQETVLAAKGWQPSPSCLRAWIGVVHH